MQQLIVYHGPTCLDGLMSAAIASLHFPHAEFMVGQYQTDIDINLFRDKEVFILDFSYPRGIMREICEVAKFVFWIDHHKSAIDAMEGFTHQRFMHKVSLERSGCALTWEFLYPYEEIPWIVKYVEDRDIWKWEYVETAAVTAALYSYPAEVEVMYNFLSAGKTQLDQLRHEGKALLRARQKEIELTIKSGLTFTQWDHEGVVYTVPILNCSPSISSEVGNILAQEHPFAVMWFDFKDYCGWSLRSAKENPDHVDVSKIAIIRGGGGHKHAAGFKTEKPALF